MIKRTTEIILVLIGIVIHGFFVIVGGFMAWIYHNESKVLEMIDEIDEGESEAAKAEFIQLISEIDNIGWYIAIGSGISLIAGAIAIYFFQKNRNAKVASITLIVTAVVTAIGSLGSAAIGGIFFFIAGLMGLLRKPQEVISETEESN